ncbi:MAG: MoaD/ThiS family protein [Nitrososphaerota archaeon]|nr:MoaD/ThiS family protein [Nitrososphaerota archaeon]MDG7037810.1 MoaD/ThiS family protein [Nitrososphaerota archaeon]MDG7040175.1 MoaD/ThiS family protein [Nitrososphaerota archaeon]MDG7041978.1 MoaD/ThiS family protein [Nitrososphaerota archaeon]MDG7043279.1 MoaD/ThiS family protein [Nitrososphaerota archaeon]
MKIKLLGSLSYKGRTRFNVRTQGPIKLKALLEKIPNGELTPGNPNLIVFINGVEFHMLGGYDAIVSESDEVTILPAAHGGSGFSVRISDNDTGVTAQKGVISVRCSRSCLRYMGHVYFTALQTWYALANDELIAKKPEVDYLMRLSRQRRISLAVKRCGAEGKPNKDVVTVSFGEYDMIGLMMPSKNITILPETGEDALIMGEESALTAI